MSFLGLSMFLQADELVLGTSSLRYTCNGEDIINELQTHLVESKSTAQTLSVIICTLNFLPPSSSMICSSKLVE